MGIDFLTKLFNIIRLVVIDNWLLLLLLLLQIVVGPYICCAVEVVADAVG
jgi:hypothetical protein